MRDFLWFQTVSNGNLMSREVDENRKKYSFEMEKNLFLCQKNFLDVEKTCSGYVKHSPSSSEQAQKKNYDHMTHLSKDSYENVTTM